MIVPPLIERKRDGGHTAKGGEWLSDGAPRTTDAIEKLMSGR